MVTAQSTSRNGQETINMASLENEIRAVSLESAERIEDELGQGLDVSDDEIIVFGDTGGVAL
jgi:hypothetical protein